MKKLNCWEYMQCGQHPEDVQSQQICHCPAAVFTAFPDGKYNNGINLGRRCWRLAGTLCNERVQGTFAEKLESCRECAFYQLVRQEEGHNFVE